jgi:hypothetical protein
MKSSSYLFDTHALLFWSNQMEVSTQFIQFFDVTIQPSANLTGTFRGAVYL